MKRKAQTAEFKPPMQRFARISRRNSRENASSGETAELQLTDTNQISAPVTASVQSAALLDNCEEHQPQCIPQLDSDLVEVHSGLKQANEPKDIKHKLQDGLTSNSNIQHPEGAGVEERANEDEDTSSPKQQTSDEAPMKPVNIGDVSGAIAVPVKACEETECLKSPPKKRLRRRMGMCGLGERKRRFLIEGLQCRQSPTEAYMEESAEATGNESGNVLKCIDVGPTLLNNEGTTELVFLEQNHSSLQQMMTVGASSTEQDIQEIQDLPSETALKSDHDTETAVSAEPNFQECRTFHDIISEASTVISECLVDVEMQYGLTGHDMEVRSMAQKELPEEEYPVEEEANYGCIDVTDEYSNKDSKETDEHPVPKKLIVGLLGVTSAVWKGSEETANQQVAPVDEAEKMNYGSTGTFEDPECSKVNAECLFEAEVHHGSTHIEEILKGSNEKNNEDVTDVAEDVSHGTDSVTDVCEGSTEQIEHLVNEARIFGSTSVTEDFKGSPEPVEHPVDEAVIYHSSSVFKICEGSIYPAEHAGEAAEDAVTTNVCESSIEANKLPVADRGIYSSTGDTEVCESSRKPTELTVQVLEEVTNGPIYFIKFCEGSKEWTDPPVVELGELESYGSVAVTDEVSADSKETIGHPPQMTEEVNYASTAITNEVSEGSREQIESPDQLAKEESYGSTAVTNEVCEGSTEPTENPVQLAEEVSYSSSVVTSEVSDGSKEQSGHRVEVAEAVTCSEGSKEPNEHPVQVVEEVSYRALALTNKACEGSKELTRHSVKMTEGVISTINYVSEGSTEQTENPVHVAEKETSGSNTVTSEASEGSKELTNHLVQVDKKESYVSTPTAFTNKASEGSPELTGVPVKVGEEESYGCTVITSEVSEGSTEWTGHPAQVAEEESYGSIAITNEVSERFRKSIKHSIQVAEDESYGSNTVIKEASKGSREMTEHSVQVAKEESYGFTAIANKAYEGSLELTGHRAQVAEEESYGSPAVTDKIHERSYKVRMEVQEALTALEESEMELNGNYQAYEDLSTVEQEPRGLHLSMQTNSKMEPVCMEHTDYGLTASTEAAFSEICETGSQFEHIELPQMLTIAAGLRATEPGGKCSSSTERLSGPKAPPTDQEEFMHDLLSEGVGDLPATPAVTKLQEVYNSTLPLAFTEFSQDHNNIPSSLYSVTDSQLNSITLGMELEDRNSPEGFVHQEDATELVCGLIKELSSLNCIVMAAHKEMEVLRQGNRPPKAPIRRSYGLRNSEI